MIGAYRMGFTVAEDGGASRLRVFIDYALPSRGGALARPSLRRLICALVPLRMVDDAVHHYAGREPHDAPSVGIKCRGGATAEGRNIALLLSDRGTVGGAAYWPGQGERCTSRVRTMPVTADSRAVVRSPLRGAVFVRSGVPLPKSGPPSD